MQKLASPKKKITKTIIITLIFLLAPLTAFASASPASSSTTCADPTEEFNYRWEKSCAATIVSGEALSVVLETDVWGSETGIEITKPDGTTDSWEAHSFGNNEEHNPLVTYNDSGNYTIKVTDSYGDGGASVYILVGISDWNNDTGGDNNSEDNLCDEELFPDGQLSPSMFDEVVVREQTSTTNLYTFSMTNNAVLQEIAGFQQGNWGGFNYDFSGWNEYYDIFLSDADSTPNPNGDYITINGFSDSNKINGAVGFNIDSVSLVDQNSVEHFAQIITNLELGNDLSGAYLDSNGYADRILHDWDDVSTRLGNQYASITVGFCDISEDTDEDNNTGGDDNNTGDEDNNTGDDDNNTGEDNNTGDDDNNTGGDNGTGEEDGRPYIPPTLDAELDTTTSPSLLSLTASNLDPSKDYTIEWLIISTDTFDIVSGSEGIEQSTGLQITDTWLVTDEIGLESGEYCLMGTLFEDGELVETEVIDCQTVVTPEVVEDNEVETNMVEQIVTAITEMISGLLASIIESKDE